MTTIPDGTNRPSATTPMPQGWVVEAIIKGRMSWMIKPEPLKSYTFTHDLAHAHVFDREGQARDCRAAVWCWHDRHGHHPSLTVIWLNDEYRAQVADNALPANHQHALSITAPATQTINTQDLTGKALDWAVTTCNASDAGAVVQLSGFIRQYKHGVFRYSTDWAQGGPIIEREGITLRCGLHGWDAELEEFDAISHGPTPLIAGLRCHVAARLGPTVDVPQELLP